MQYSGNVLFVQRYPCLVESFVDCYVVCHLVYTAVIDSEFAERHRDTDTLVKLMDSLYALFGR